jgi:hypothetical protein
MEDVEVEQREMEIPKEPTAFLMFLKEMHASLCDVSVIPTSEALRLGI